MNRVLSLWLVVAVALARSALARRRADARPRRAAAPRRRRVGSSGACVHQRQGEGRARRVPGTGPQLRRPAHGKAPQMSFHSKRRRTSRRATSRSASDTADVSMLAGIRDERQTALKQRVLALLVTEIQQLESLYKSTDARSKDRPMLLRRLAEDYVELENAAFREKTEAEVKRDDAEEDATRARPASSRRSRTRARRRWSASRKAAINVLHAARHRLLGPAVEHVPEQPAAGLPARSTRSTTTSRTSTSRRATRPTRGASTSTSSRRRRTRSTSRTRTSRSASSSSTRRRATRRKWEPAKQAYMKVIAKPPPENKVYGYAWYKLAYVFWNQGDFAARARRLQEDDRLRHARTRSCRTRRSSPRARARTSSRSTRSRATRPTPTTSSRT